MDHLLPHPLNSPAELLPSQIPSFWHLLRTHHLPGSLDWPPLFQPLHTSPLCSYGDIHRAQLISQFFSNSLLPSREKKIQHLQTSIRALQDEASGFSLQPHLTSFLCCNVSHHTEQRWDAQKQSSLTCLCTCCSLYLSRSYLHPEATPHLPQDSVWNTLVSLGSLPCALTFDVLYLSSELLWHLWTLF